MDYDRAYSPRPAPTMANPGSGDPGSRRRKAALLATLAVLMVATIAGTSYLVVAQLHASDSGKTAHAAAPTASAPLPSLTPTPDRSLPTNNGWTSVTAAGWGDTQFAASNPLRGYLCGSMSYGNERVLGITTDGGQTWSLGKSPASYTSCYLQISPTNPLDVTLTSVNAPGDGASAFVEAHYSSDGAKTWKAAPIPPNTLGGAQLLWSGPYLYLLLGDTLQVSVNGGPFTAIALGNLGLGSGQITLTGASTAATANRLYLNVQTSACQSPCDILLASSNGGASWAKISNNGNVLLEQVQGNVLYGGVMDGQPYLTTIMRSSNGGASWDTISLPTLPSGLEITSYVVAPDQTIFVWTRGEVAALHDGTWKVYPFSVSGTDVYMDSLEMTAVSFDGSGHPLKIWGHDEGAHPGIYWRSV